MNTSASLLGKLQGFLIAMEQINTRVNHGCTFSIDPIAMDADPTACITRALADQSIEFTDLKLEPLEPWRPAVKSCLSRWLLQFQEPENCDRSLWNHEHLPEIDRKRFLQPPLEWLDALVGKCDVYEFKIHPVGFYECDWNDFLIHSTESAYWLHLGVSD
ncbi:hypothetical protein Pan97_08740 [Bremerella volcania]|uniref:Uncharacterized protein n=1 Tax=Bremerella volcania TaxID=2527984 RepID=A0A518C3V6_9BACT|nr:hypothetical protein [Bremerella volcania]QDU73874.1 hypothetical protein Pan97_08740 [Bremerella volcania]